jgi:hypothetical protein
MKKLLFTLIVSALSFNTQSQITLEHTYSGVGNYGPNSFEILKLDSNEYRYLNVDYNNQLITLYNMNHTVDQTVNIPYFYDYNYSITYVSRSLIDCDTNNIEFLINYDCSPYPCVGGFVEVRQDKGNILFHSDSAVLYASIGINNRYPIVNTPFGTKMLLNYYGGSIDEVRVFSLCGTNYSNEIKPENDQELIFAYPNPTSELVHLPYILPQGIKTGKIELIDFNGIKIQEYKVDNNFKDIIVNMSEYEAGTYFYRVTNSQGNGELKKIIKMQLFATND